MPEYRVRWEIDGIEADSPLQAARIALGIQRDPESIASVFLVQPMYDDDDDWTEIDISNQGKSA